MNKVQQILKLFLDEKKSKEKKSNFQSDQSPKIEEIKLKQLYDIKVPSDYPKAFDKTFTVKDIKGKPDVEEIVIVVTDESGKPKATKPLKIVDVTKKAVGISDPAQSDQIRSYVPKVQMLVRGAYKDEKKTVVIVESPEWLLKNITGKGIKI